MSIYIIWEYLEKEAIYFAWGIHKTVAENLQMFKMQLNNEISTNQNKKYAFIFKAATAQEEALSQHRFFPKFIFYIQNWICKVTFYRFDFYFSLWYIQMRIDSVSLVNALNDFYDISNRILHLWHFNTWYTCDYPL